MKGVGPREAKREEERRAVTGVDESKCSMSEKRKNVRPMSDTLLPPTRRFLTMTSTSWMELWIPLQVVIIVIERLGFVVWFFEL